jgi:hypothetical protein
VYRSRPPFSVSVSLRRTHRAAVLLCAVVAAASVTFVANPPTVSADQPHALVTEGGPGDAQPTAAELKLAAAKKLVAAAEQASAEAVRSGAVSPASCPMSAGGVEPYNACMPYWGYVATHARQQIKSYYCGPAAVQVVANYAWGYSGTTNKYSQSYISSTWTKTDQNGQTMVGDERYGLNQATKGHVPGGWVYVAVRATSGSDWHNMLRTDVGVYAMPIVVTLAPHDVGASYWLRSWPKAMNAGHYIVVNGWNQVWDNTRNPTVTYDDGSSGYGGSTGEFSDPAFDVYYTIDIHDGWTIW